MKNFFVKSISLISIVFLVSSCARDLSSSVYTSDSTMNLTLEGQVIAARNITLKESDRLLDSKEGMLGGGALGGFAAGKGGSSTAATAGIIGGAIIGSIVQNKLGEAQGKEYIIKVDTSKLTNKYFEGTAAMRNAIAAATTSGLITVIQGVDNPLSEGQTVYVIFSEKRVRVIGKK